MKKLFLAFLMLAFMVPTAQAAEGLVQSMLASGPYKVYNLVWVTDGSGDFTATELNQPIDGIVLMFEAIPSGTAAPTASHDITLRNSSGIDVPGDTGVAGSEAEDGALSNLSATIAKEVMPLLNGNYTSIPVMGKLTIDVLSAGNDASGTVRIHFLSVN